MVPGRVERAFMLASVLLTVALFAYVGWQAVTTPAEPNAEAHVMAIGVTDSGDVRVTVDLVNSGGIGFIMIEVTVECDDPPPVLSFQNVPTDGRRTGTVLCPPGTVDPQALISAWIES